MNMAENINNTQDEFITMAPASLLAKHAIPAVISMLFMAFYQIVDGMLVGRRLGSDALASINILYPVIALLSGLAVMVGVGGNTRIAILLGSGKKKLANRVFGFTTAVAIALGLFLSLATMLLMPQIMAFLGSSGQMGEYASVYLIQLTPFFTPMILMFILSQAVRNDGQPGLASIIMISSALLNIVLDYIFLFVLDMGISGAALATGIAQTSGSLVFAGYFIAKKIRDLDGLGFAAPVWSLQLVSAIAVNGSSEFFNSIAAGITTFLFNRAILHHVGSTGVAAFTLVQYLIMLGMAFVMGIGNGVQPIISYNYGAGLFKRVKETIIYATAAATAMGMIVFLIMSWQTAGVTNLFLPDNPVALQLTADAAAYVRWSMLCMPLAMLGSIYYTAIEKAAKSFVLAMLRSLLLPAACLLLLPGIWQTTGIWITPFITELLTMLLAILLLLGTYRDFTRAELRPQLA